MKELLEVNKRVLSLGSFSIEMIFGLRLRRLAFRSDDVPQKLGVRGGFRTSRWDMGSLKLQKISSQERILPNFDKSVRTMFGPVFWP